MLLKLGFIQVDLMPVRYEDSLGKSVFLLFVSIDGFVLNDEFLARFWVIFEFVCFSCWGFRHYLEEDEWLMSPEGFTRGFWWGFLFESQNLRVFLESLI